MQFVIDDAKKKNRVGKAVMNMSLGGDFSQAINRAIEALFKAGVVPVVAAGNENVSDQLSDMICNLTDYVYSVRLPLLLLALPPTPLLSVLLMPLPMSVLISPTLAPRSTSTLPVLTSSVSVSSQTLTPLPSAVPAWVCSPSPPIKSSLKLTCFIASPHVAGLAAYLMGFQQLDGPAQVASLIKSLAGQTGAKVKNNVQGTTSNIANNGNQ